jgi:hypothetical protein
MATAPQERGGGADQARETRRGGCAFAEVAGGAEGAEVGGVVGAAAGEGADVVDVERGLVGAAAAGAAAVVVALEDEPAEARADGLSRVGVGGGEELIGGDLGALEAGEADAGLAEAAPAEAVGTGRDASVEAEVVGRGGGALGAPDAAEVVHQRAGVVVARVGDAGGLERSAPAAVAGAGVGGREGAIGPGVEVGALERGMRGGEAAEGAEDRAVGGAGAVEEVGEGGVALKDGRGVVAMVLRGHGGPPFGSRLPLPRGGRSRARAQTRPGGRGWPVGPFISGGGEGG